MICRTLPLAKLEQWRYNKRHHGSAVFCFGEQAYEGCDFYESFDG